MSFPKTYYIETFGCQMNEYDSQLVETILGADGMIPASDKESSDCLLLNTCSVREHAEQRVFSLLSQHKALKNNNPAMKIVLLGCMASKHQDELLHRFPHLDLVVGPDGYRNLPALMKAEKNIRTTWLGNNPLEEYNDIIPAHTKISAYIAIARGCDNFCSYCVVPYVRGGERSRPADSIIEEMKQLASQGIREITLLGQNVNSYRYNDCDFAGLLRRANEVDDIIRIRFITSHPKDLSEDLLNAMAECEKAAPHLHLPFQAGSDRILRLMNRKYTRSEYLELVDKVRRFIPGISLTTDIIAGFPTETEDNFQQTLEIIRRVRFDDAFTYRYSPRPGTAAAEMPDDVPEEVKIDRLERMISAVRKIARQNLQDLISRKFTVLIEHKSKKDPDWWMGRTEHNRIAVIPKEKYKPGELVEMRVETIAGFTLKGAIEIEAKPIFIY
ncbi:MAG: tRNA (N6-isopentenyl adenosine(37)-C2)-methylthiotransferase MiaB [candidate division Zixibacteria bacterium]|nr:tRNA (N6-isopentenyl adenosine(37)-C2)-methylthiotransferase MiaB [Candidatus Tariuqbacter arcticus]